MLIELSHAIIPRQALGYYITRRHYHNHIISINLYLGKGHKISLTLLESNEIKIKFHNYA